STKQKAQSTKHKAQSTKQKAQSTKPKVPRKYKNSKIKAPTDPTSKIRVLADHVANQIAAGEVVERPASVAKELVENSIDADATRINIEIEGGGRRLLKVSDDGEGMVRDDAILAFERHATSKIRETDDLAAIGTLGSRGEALASIASVAKVELTTC